MNRVLLTNTEAQDITDKTGFGALVKDDAGQKYIDYNEVLDFENENVDRLQQELYDAEINVDISALVTFSETRLTTLEQTVNVLGDDNIKYRVDAFSDIATVATSPVEGELTFVKNESGTPLVDYKPSGLYVYRLGVWSNDVEVIKNDIETNKNSISAIQSQLPNKLEAVDISDFETSTELDTRDVNNRDRSNHTGTQTAVTISDFTTASRLASIVNSMAGSETDQAPSVISVANYVAAEVANLINGAPGTLDQINELADAIGNDPNFVTTVTNLVNAVQTNLDNHIAAPDPHPQYETSAEAQAKVDTHANLTTNPHSVTFTQAVASDSGTDITPAEAEELTDGSTTQLHTHVSYLPVSGRFYCYVDNRWVGPNPSYGYGNENFNNNRATGAAPTEVWNGLGLPVPQGAVLKNLNIRGRTNNTEVTDMEVCIRYHTTDLSTGAAIDSNAENSFVEIVAPVSLNHTKGGPGNMADMHETILSLSDYSTPIRGELFIYMRPQGTLTATRYFYTSMILEYTLP